MTRSTTWGLVVLMAMLSACGQDSGVVPTPVAGAPVTGSRIKTYFQDDGTTQTRVASDLAQTSVSALTLESGRYRQSPGHFGPDGTFSIPEVGSGGYLLQVNLPNQVPRFFEQSARSIDLGVDLVGRPSRTFATLPSLLTFSLSNLEPWGAGSGVTVFSTGAALTAQAPSAAMAAGATAGDFLLDLKGKPLPEAGDLGWVLQLAQRTAGVAALPYSVVARSAALVSLATMADGDFATLPVPLSVPASSGTVGLDLRRSEFVAGLAALAPGAAVTPGIFSVSVRAYPRSLGAQVSGSLLSFSPQVGTSDLNLGTLDYPRPFPAWFTEVRVLDYLISVKLPAALGISGTTLNYVVSRTDLLPGAPAIIAPALGPARLPTIAGRDALVPQAGVGLTPTISWSSPSLGTPTRYMVSIYEWAGGVLTLRATLNVAGTSAAIPPLVLVPGSVYSAIILAISEPNFDIANPFRTTAPRDQVPLFTSHFSP